MVSSKLHKIKYKINLLPVLGKYISNVNDVPTLFNQDIKQFMNSCVQSEQWDIFTTANLIDLIEFKWSSYAGRVHKLGFVMHLFYLGVLIYNIDQIYMYANLNPGN